MISGISAGLWKNYWSRAACKAAGVNCFSEWLELSLSGRPPFVTIYRLRRELKGWISRNSFQEPPFFLLKVSLPPYILFVEFPAKPEFTFNKNKLKVGGVLKGGGWKRINGFRRPLLHYFNGIVTSLYNFKWFHLERFYKIN